MPALPFEISEACCSSAMRRQNPIHQQPSAVELDQKMRSDLLLLAAALTLAVCAAAVTYFFLVIRPRRAEARRTRNDIDRVQKLMTTATTVNGAMRLGGQQERTALNTAKAGE